MVAERVVLLRIEDLEQRGLRVAAEVGADLVDLVDHHHRILGAGVTQRANDRPRHRADIGAPVPADFGFVAHPSDREAHEFAAHRACDRLPERRFPDARRSDETEDRTGHLLFEFSDREIFDDAILDFVEIVVVGVENLARLHNLDRVARRVLPRQLHEPIEVGANHRVLGRRGRHFRKALQLAIGRLLDVLRHRRFVDFLAEFVGFGLLRIGLAKLFLNRAQLLAEIELALILLHLTLNVRLNLVSELDDLQFLGQHHRQLAHALLGVALFEQSLTVARIEPHRARDEVRQKVGVGDVVDFHLHLARRLRQIADQLREKPGEVAMHRQQIVGLHRDVGDFGNLGRDVRFGLREFLDAEDGITADDAADRPVGDLDHALDGADRPNAAQIVGLGILDILVFEGDEADLFAVAQRFLDQYDARPLDDGQRDHRVRKQDRVLQRQYADEVDFAFGGNGTGH